MVTKKICVIDYQYLKQKLSSGSKRYFKKIMAQFTSSVWNISFMNSKTPHSRERMCDEQLKRK